MQENRNQEIFERFDKINVNAESASEESKPITLWIPKSVQERYLVLNKDSKYDLGKELQKLVVDIIKYKDKSA
jgi:hypothetical protein